MSATLPLAGLRVIELGTVVAGPFCGSMMADLGADVIKIEPPVAGDPQRQMGHEKDGVPLWWGVDAREKKCLVLNLKNTAGREFFLKFVETADVLIENYRPGVMQRLGLGWSDLSRINPKLIMLTTTGYGETGPKSPLPGFGKVAEGLSGMLPLVGPPGAHPLFVGFSLADTSAAMFGLFAVSVALYERDLGNAGGVHIDLALYEPLLRMLDCRLAIGSSGDTAPARTTTGPFDWGSAAGGGPQVITVRCRTDEWLAIAIPDETIADEIIRMIAPSTRAGGADLDTTLSDWAGALAPSDAARVLTLLGASAAPVFDGLSIARDPYFRARGDVLDVDTMLGSISVPGPYPKDAHHIAVMTRFRPAALGADNNSVLASEFGLTPEEIGDLKTRGAF